MIFLSSPVNPVALFHLNEITILSKLPLPSLSSRQMLFALLALFLITFFEKDTICILYRISGELCGCLLASKRMFAHFLAAFITSSLIYCFTFMKDKLSKE